MITGRRLAALLLATAACLTVGCGRMETTDELQTPTADAPPEPVGEVEAAPTAGAPPAAGEDLDGFPLVGSVFPGLRSGLHSSLCDPASDPYSTCI